MRRPMIYSIYYDWYRSFSSQLTCTTSLYTSIFFPTLYHDCNSPHDFVYTWNLYFEGVDLWLHTHGLSVLLTVLIKHWCPDKLQVYVFCPCFAEKLRDSPGFMSKILRKFWANFGQILFTSEKSLIWNIFVERCRVFISTFDDLDFPVCKNR